MIIQQTKYIIQYCYKNIIRPKILNIKYKDILRENLSLQNSKKGKRCFILGTGPSIQSIDLNILKNEDTFAVNDFDKFPAFSNLCPKYYVLMDTIYFASNNNDNIWAKNIEHKLLAIPKDTYVFTNILNKNKIEEKKLFPYNPKYYLSLCGLFSDKINFTIDIDKTIPYVKNVTLACLIIAVYMGYEEIYLLGCEHNYLASRSSVGKLKIIDHCYEEDEMKNIDANDKENIKKYALERDFQMSYESCIANTLQLFKNYRLFYQKVKKIHPETKIYNATPNSFLDVFPTIDFKNISF